MNIVDSRRPQEPDGTWRAGELALSHRRANFASHAKPGTQQDLCGEQSSPASRRPGQPDQSTAAQIRYPAAGAGFPAPTSPSANCRRAPRSEEAQARRLRSDRRRRRSPTGPRPVRGIVQQNLSREGETR